MRRADRWIRRCPRPRATFTMPARNSTLVPGRIRALLAWRRDVRRFRRRRGARHADRRARRPHRLRALGRQLPADALRARRRRRAPPRDRRRISRRANREALAAYEGDRARIYAAAETRRPERGAGASGGVLRRGDRARPRPRRAHHAGDAALFLGLRAAHVLARRARARARRRLGVDPRSRGARGDRSTSRAAWTFIAYLCVGWPEEAHATPELERAGWQAPRRADADRPLRLA